MEDRHQSRQQPASDQIPSGGELGLAILPPPVPPRDPDSMAAQVDRVWAPHRVSADNIKRRPEVAVLSIAEGLCRTPSKLNARNRDGDTFLHVAAKSGYVRVVDYILEKAPAAVDINALSAGGLTPLAYACRSGHCAIVVRLIGLGAEVGCLQSTPAASASASKVSPSSHLARHLPPTPSERTAVLQAIEAGLQVYRANLSERLLDLRAPFDRLPTDLIPFITEYACGAAPPATPLYVKLTMKTPEESAPDEAEPVPV